MSVDGRERIAGFKVAVAVVLIDVAMEAVGAGLQDDVKNSARGPTMLSGKRVCYRLELRDRVGSGTHRHVVCAFYGVQAAVQIPDVRTRLGAIRRNLGAKDVRRVGVAEDLQERPFRASSE